MLQSKGRHNVHSPFVFEFVDACLTTKLDKNFRLTLKKWYKSIKNDRTKIQISDLGAGSRKLAQIRSPRELLKKSSSKGVYGDLLYKIEAHYKPGISLELGTSIGVGSVHLKAGNPKGHLITVEGCPETEFYAEKQLASWNFERLTTIQSSFADFFARGSSLTYDLVYIDGHHSGEATKNYLENLSSQIHNETILILDDIRWNDDMWQCWNDLIASENYHLSIDLGRMGILVKRPQQVKEHFTLRPIIWKTKLL